MWDLALVAGFVLAILGLVWLIGRDLKRAGQTEAERDQLAHTGDVKDKQLRAVVEAPRGREGIVEDIRERGVF